MSPQKSEGARAKWLDLTPAPARAGRVIHEFDPWFNYRATEYMAANGWDKFQVGAHSHQSARPTAPPLGK